MNQTINELKTRGDVEKFCSNHIDSFQKGFDVTIKNFFERFEREKSKYNLEYVCTMNYLHQKVLSKIIMKSIIFLMIKNFLRAAKFVVMMEKLENNQPKFYI